MFARREISKNPMWQLLCKYDMEFCFRIHYMHFGKAVKEKKGLLNTV